MKKRTVLLQSVCFFLIAVVCFSLRLYKINGPVADWHSFRQSDTASVARRFVSEGIDLLRPKYDDLSNIQSGKDNPQGYRMVEFPLYQGIAVSLFKVMPKISLEIWLRLLTIIASTTTCVLLGLLVSRRVSFLSGIFTSLTYAILPYSIFYGRVILPDPFMVSLSFGSLFLFDVWLSKKSFLLLFSSMILGALALLVKPVAAFLLLPIPLVFVLEKKWEVSRFLQMGLWGIVVGAPFLWWRQWILQFPAGIPAADWLFNKDNIRLKGAWFQWLFAERIGKLILGYWGLIPFGIGLIRKNEKHEGWTFWWLLVGSLSYMVIIAGGNVQHDYYQITILPVIAIFVGKGLGFLFEQKEIQKVTSIGVAIVSMVFAFAFSWYTIRTYYWINRPEIIEAGKMADAILPKDAKVIAPYNGDTTFLYQTKRSGWPLGFDIDKKIEMGATHYVTVSPTDADLETRDLSAIYTVLFKNDKFAIIDLTKKK